MNAFFIRNEISFNPLDILLQPLVELPQLQSGCLQAFLGAVDIHGFFADAGG